MTKPIEPTVEGGAEVYNSSEELHMAHRAAFVLQEQKEKEQKHLNEKQKIQAVLDKYITKYSKTSEVRKLAQAGKKSAAHYLDVAADVVEILEKIKNESMR